MDITHRVGSRTTRGRLSRLSVLLLLVAAFCLPAGLVAVADQPVRGNAGSVPLPGPMPVSAGGQSKPAAPAGVNFADKRVVRFGPYSAQSGYWSWVQVYCPAGTIPTGGGEFNTKTGLSLRSSHALFDSTGWRVEVVNLTGEPADVTVYAVCVSGVTSYSHSFGKTVVDPNQTGAAFAHCPNGTRLIGNGGFSDVFGTNTYLTGSPTFNQATYVGSNGDAGSRTINAQAICGNGVADLTSAGGNEVSPPVGQSYSSLAVCPAGTRVLSGGGVTVNGSLLRLTDSYPEGEGWRAYFYNNGVQIATSKAVAVCGR